MVNIRVLGGFRAVDLVNFERRNQHLLLDRLSGVLLFFKTFTGQVTPGELLNRQRGIFKHIVLTTLRHTRLIVDAQRLLLVRAVTVDGVLESEAVVGRVAAWLQGFKLLRLYFLFCRCLKIGFAC